MDHLFLNTTTGGVLPLSDLRPGYNFVSVLSWGIDAPAFLAGGSHMRGEIAWMPHIDPWVSVSLVSREGWR